VLRTTGPPGTSRPSVLRPQARPLTVGLLQDAFAVGVRSLSTSNWLVVVEQRASERIERSVGPT
jgi:hypothetical protein